jgi:hypothetical protein
MPHKQKSYIKPVPHPPFSSPLPYSITKQFKIEGNRGIKWFPYPYVRDASMKIRNLPSKSHDLSESQIWIAFVA